MTTSTRRVSRRQQLLAAVAGLPLLLGACASQDTEQDAEPAAADRRSDETATSDRPDSSVRSACPAQLRASALTDTENLGAADIDGDGAADQVAVGAVPDGSPACAVALVVTTSADGVSVVPLSGATTVPVQAALGMPVFAPVDDAPGDEIVLATSWNPRGGGEIGMFSWVDGQLVQVTQGAQPYGLFATVDDGGGMPQLLACVPGGFLHVTENGPTAHMTAYSLRDGAVTKLTGRAAEDLFPPIRDTYPGMPDQGLVAFPDCG